MIAPSVFSAAPSAPPQLGQPVWRHATPEDDRWIEELQALAFGPGRFARTAFRIRERFPIDKSLSLVAEVNGVPCGSVWMTPISIGGLNGYMLGPLATHPDFRRLGVGKLLARTVTEMALDQGEASYVMLVGDFDYYGPLGYARTTSGAIQFPGPVDPERVLLYSRDPTLALRIAGPIGPFRH